MLFQCLFGNWSIFGVISWVLNIVHETFQKPPKTCTMYPYVYCEKGLTCIFSSLFSFYYLTLTCILWEIVSIAGRFWLLFVQKCHYPAFLRCCMAPIPFWRYTLVKLVCSGYLSATKILAITGKSWANHI